MSAGAVPVCATMRGAGTSLFATGPLFGHVLSSNDLLLSVSCFVLCHCPSATATCGGGIAVIIARVTAVEHGPRDPRLPERRTPFNRERVATSGCLEIEAQQGRGFETSCSRRSSACSSSNRDGPTTSSGFLAATGPVALTKPAGRFHHWGWNSAG